MDAQPRQDEATSAAAPTHVDLQWQHVDKTRFFCYGISFFFGVRLLVFPSNVVKTRQQVSGKSSVYKSTTSAFVNIVRKDGPFALYKGFGVTALGIIPIQGVFISSYEISRSWACRTAESFSFQPAQAAAVGNAVGGACASLCAQSIVVPVDVIAQRLMLQTAESGRVGARDLVTAITRSEGVRGLYRGFLPSILTNLPSSAVWWGVYGLMRHTLLEQLKVPPPGNAQSSSMQVAALQCLASFCASCASVTLTNPMDVIKTRLQTAKTLIDGHPPTITTTVQQLVREEGLAWVAKGWAARLLSSAPVSALMILSYELTKRLSVKDEFRHLVE